MRLHKNADTPLGAVLSIVLIAEVVAELIAWGL